MARSDFIADLRKLERDGFVEIEGDLEGNFPECVSGMTAKGMQTHEMLDAVMSALGLGRQPYHAAHAVLRQDDDEPSFATLYVSAVEGYEAAVGRAFLNVTEDFPPDEGWCLLKLEVDKEVIWREATDETEENDEIDAVLDTFERVIAEAMAESEAEADSGAESGVKGGNDGDHPSQ